MHIAVGSAVGIYIAVHIAVSIKCSVFFLLQNAVHIAVGIEGAVWQWVLQCRSQLAVKLRQLSMFGQRPEHHSARLSVHYLSTACALPVHCLHSNVGSAQSSSPQTTLLNSTALLWALSAHGVLWWRACMCRLNWSWVQAKWRKMHSESRTELV